MRASLPDSSSGAASSSPLPEKVVELLREASQKDAKIAQQLEGILPEKSADAEMRQQQQLLNRIRKVKMKIQRKEASLTTKDIQLKKILEQVRVHVKNEKDRYHQETSETKKELEELKIELQQLREGHIPTKDSEMEEMTLDSLLAPGEAESDGLQAALAAAKEEAASAKSMAYSMKQQMDTMMAHFQTMKHLQPGGFTPPPSEDLTAMDGTAPKIVGALPPGLAHLPPQGSTFVKDPQPPFGVKPKERSGPYTPNRGTGKGVEKPALNESMD